MGPLLGTRRRHCSLFFFSHNTASNFLFEEVASRRHSRSLHQQLGKVFASLEAHICGGSCIQNHPTWRKKEDFFYSSETMGQSARSFAPASWLLLRLILWKKAEGQRLSALFCFSGLPVDKLVPSILKD